MYHLRANHIYAVVAMGEGNRVIGEDVEEGFLSCVAVCVFREGGGWGDVKGIDAQTCLSLGTLLAYSSLLFNCQGRGQRLGTIAPKPFIMGQFVVVLLSTAINTTHHHIYTHTADGRQPNRDRGMAKL